MNAFEQAAREAIAQAQQTQEIIPVNNKPFTIAAPQQLNAHWVEVCKPETGLSIQCRSDLYENVQGDPNFWNAVEVIMGLDSIT